MIALINTFIFSLNHPYWYNPSIHNLGNTGMLGNLHAAATPLFTKLIDKKAYSGVDIRKQIYEEMHGSVCAIYVAEQGFPPNLDKQVLIHLRKC